MRVLHGAEFERFDTGSQQAFFSNPHQITTQADRMGYRLDGEPLSLSEKSIICDSLFALRFLQQPTKIKVSSKIIVSIFLYQMPAAKFLDHSSPFLILLGLHKKYI